MKIAEIYESVQGEGFLTGTPSAFVRASGCNLRCVFCDTRFASWEPEGEDLAVHEIVRAVQDFGTRHVVLTGGEPMLFSELVPLCEMLKADGRHITIETAGTLYLPLECDLMSISPKLSNSTPPAKLHPKWHPRHEQARQTPHVVRRLIRDYRYQLKFVIGDESDCAEAEAYLLNLPEAGKDRVLLMPEGTSPSRLDEIAQWLAPYCRQRGYLFCPRQQIAWFGAQRGT